MAAFSNGTVDLSGINLDLGALHHRGPDSSNFSLTDQYYLGQTRLAIIGNVVSGQQPFTSRDRKWTVIYNGEIYNYRQLAESLGLRGEISCDGQVIPEVLSKFDIAGIEKLRGMYSLIAIDHATNRKIVCVDPFGIKPLNVYIKEDLILCASEIRALLPHLQSKRVDLEAMSQLLHSGFMLPHQSGIQGISRLSPGQLIVINQDFSITKTNLNVSTFQSRTLAKAEIKTWDDAALALSDSVNCHFLSDAPVSLFYSGGFDSAAIATLAKRLGHKPSLLHLKSADANERRLGDIRTFARLKGLELELFDVLIDDTVADEYFKSIDRPSIDGLNTFLISRCASKSGFRVGISGLGADEVLTGYLNPRILKAANLAKLIPHELRKYIWAFLRDTNLPKAVERLSSLAEINHSSTEKDLRLALTHFLRHIQSEEAVQMLLGIKPDCPSYLKDKLASINDSEGDFFHLNLFYYLSGCLLADSDIYSMANSLELRVPFLDKEFINAVQSIPSRSLTKVPLARSLKDPYLLHLAKSKKEGFDISFSHMLQSREIERFRSASLNENTLSGFIHQNSTEDSVNIKKNWKWQSDWIILCIDKWMLLNGIAI